jgi:hypothetical protein
MTCAEVMVHRISENQFEIDNLKLLPDLFDTLFRSNKIKSTSS